MIFRNKDYPFGKYQVLFLAGNYFNFKKSIGFWKHPTFVLGSYAEWSLRLIFIEIKKWLPEGKIYFRRRINNERL